MLLANEDECLFQQYCFQQVDQVLVAEELRDALEECLVGVEDQVIFGQWDPLDNMVDVWREVALIQALEDISQALDV